MRYVSAERLHRGLLNLKAWGDATGQTKSHLALFLSAKLRDVNAATATEFRDVDDKNFWNRYMRLQGAERPFFDPAEGDYRPVAYPHNSAFKSRNDRWQADDWRVAKRSGEEWQFEFDYVARLREKALTRGGNVYAFPEPDVVAWLYRAEGLAADIDYDTLRQRFRDEFHVTATELAELFSDVAFDGEPEGDAFFADRRVSEELLVEIAKGGDDFELAAAIEAIAESSGPQPIELADAIRLATEGRRQVIFQGPPGTGKTYLARQVAAGILGAADEVTMDSTALTEFLLAYQVSSSAELAIPHDHPGTWEIVQFHPSYNYEDFVRGIASTIDGDRPVFRAVDRTIGVLAKLAAGTDKPVVLIVDEINRGDLSKVLGELIFALEYRGESVRTPYEVDGSPLLALPENLYLLATMNTADRSIALIDYAIRRRFDFVDLGASRDTLEQFLVHNAVPLEVTERTLALFDAVNKPLADHADHQVGHTYFMTVEPAKIAQRFAFQVLPLLAEYRREGLIGENVRVRPAGWPRDRGVPLVHPRPFDLVDQVVAWLTTGL